jgi:hypothetical protein
MVADIDQFWSGFECNPCDLVFDVRTDNEPMLEALCPKCKQPLKTRGTWNADDSGYGGRGCPGNEANYEDRMGALVFAIDGVVLLKDFVAVPEHKTWLETGESESEVFVFSLGFVPLPPQGLTIRECIAGDLFEKNSEQLFDSTLQISVAELNKQAKMLARHRMVTTAGLREQTWAAKKAFTKVMALVAQLGAKRRGPGLSPADKTLLEKLGEIAGLLEEARLSE